MVLEHYVEYNGSDIPDFYITFKMPPLRTGSVIEKVKLHILDYGSDFAPLLVFLDNRLIDTITYNGTLRDVWVSVNLGNEQLQYLAIKILEPKVSHALSLDVVEIDFRVTA